MSVSLIRRVALDVDFCCSLWTSLSAKIFKLHQRRDKLSRKEDGREMGDQLLCLVQTVTCVRCLQRARQRCRVWLFAPIKHRHSLVSTAVTHCSRNDNNNLHSSYIDVSSV